MQFRIDLSIIDYMATYTALFNEVVIHPDNHQKDIIEMALKISKGELEQNNANYPKEIKYLVDMWIVDNDDSSELENISEKILYLHTAAKKYLNDRKTEELAREITAKADYEKLANQVEHLIISLESALEKNLKMPSNRTNDIIKHNRISMCFRNFHQIKYNELSSEEVYYYMVCNKKFGEILFTSCLDCWSIKYELLWQCVKKNNIPLLKHYTCMMISTCSKNTESKWNRETQQIISWMVNSYERDLDVKYDRIDKTRLRETIITIANEIMPCIDEGNCQKIKNSLLKFGYGFDNDSYVNKLINDVSNYAKIPRPRGYGGRINEISTEIRESFKTLPKMGRYDVLEQVINILIEAGPSLKPINGLRWLDNLFFLGDDSVCLQVVKNCPKLMKIWFSQEKTDFDYDRVMMKIRKDNEAVKMFNDYRYQRSSD